MVQVEQQDDGKFKVTDGAEVIEKDVETEAAAKAIAAEQGEGEKVTELEAKDLEAQVKSLDTKANPASSNPHNPHGLDIHERVAKLLETLGKHGIRHDEEAHPAQNPMTADSNYVKPQHS